MVDVAASVVVVVAGGGDGVGDDDYGVGRWNVLMGQR